MTREERSEYSKNYHKAHKKEISERHARYYQEHKAEACERTRLYRIEHKDKVAEALERIKDRRPIYQKRYRDKHKEQISIWYSEWYKKNGRNRLNGEYISNNIWRTANPEKVAAHIAVASAIKKGIIIKPSECSICHKVARIHAHHSDYTKPLDIQWVCVKCHMGIHKKA